MKIRAACIAISSLCVATMACAQPNLIHRKNTSQAGNTTTVTNSIETPLTRKSGITGGLGATTTYTMPGRGPDGPIAGNQVGSSTNTGVGVHLTIPLGEGPKGARKE